MNIKASVAFLKSFSVCRDLKRGRQFILGRTGSVMLQRLQAQFPHYIIMSDSCLVIQTSLGVYDYM